MAWGIRIGTGETTTSSSRPSVSGPGGSWVSRLFPNSFGGPEPTPVGAPCAGVDDAHQVARSGDRVVEPDLGVDHRLREAEQLLQLVDRRSRRTRRRSRPSTRVSSSSSFFGVGVLAGVGERRRVVAPGLAHRIGGVAVADDRPAERRGEHPRPPGLRQVPVVGDLVVVEDHVGGRVGQRPGDPRHGGPEDLGSLDLLGEVQARPSAATSPDRPGPDRRASARSTPPSPTGGSPRRSGTARTPRRRWPAGATARGSTPAGASPAARRRRAGGAGRRWSRSDRSPRTTLRRRCTGNSSIVTGTARSSIGSVSVNPSSSRPMALICGSRQPDRSSA